MEPLAGELYDRLLPIVRRRSSGEGRALPPNELIRASIEDLIEERGGRTMSREELRAAATVARRILVDLVRPRPARPPALPIDRESALDEAVVRRALERLAQVDERRARVAGMRLEGRADEEIANVLGVTTRVVKRDWSAAREWLAAELR